MKRTLLSLLGFILLLGAVDASAQTDAKAKAVIDRYNQASGFDKQNVAKSSALMEVQISMAGQGIPMKVIKGAQNGCFRIEMTIPGQGPMLMVTDGKNGWVAIKGQPTQPLPKEAIDQMASQGDVSGSLSVDDKNFDYTYLGQERGNDMIAGTIKAGATLPVKSLTLYFSESTGLLSQINTTDDKGKVIELKVSDYKKFGDVMMPTHMETTIPGAQNAVVAIKNVEFGIPTEAWMFAKPAQIQ